MYQPTVVFDFDGVIHSYKSGWKGAENIPDPPVDGIQQVIENLQERGYRVVIVSSRCTTSEGIKAIENWLKHYDFPQLEIMSEKPPAVVYVDDRAIGCSPQEARSVLPNSLKTEVVMTANLREWRHFIKLRSASAAHPDMRRVARMLYDLLSVRYPVFFEDIEV